MFTVPILRKERDGKWDRINSHSCDKQGFLYNNQFRKNVSRPLFLPHSKPKQSNQDGGEEMRSSPSPTNTSKKYIYMWNNSHRILLNAGRRPHTSKRTKRISTWPGRIKDKKTERNLDRTCTPGRKLWKSKDARTPGSPLTSRKRDQKCIWRNNYGWKLPKPKEGNTSRYRKHRESHTG